MEDPVPGPALPGTFSGPSLAVPAVVSGTTHQPESRGQDHRVEHTASADSQAKQTHSTRGREALRRALRSGLVSELLVTAFLVALGVGLYTIDPPSSRVFFIERDPQFSRKATLNQTVPPPLLFVYAVVIPLVGLLAVAGLISYFLLRAKAGHVSQTVGVPVAAPEQHEHAAAAVGGAHVVISPLRSPAVVRQWAVRSTLPAPGGLPDALPKPPHAVTVPVPVPAPVAEQAPPPQTTGTAQRTPAASVPGCMAGIPVRSLAVATSLLWLSLLLGLAQALAVALAGTGALKVAFGWPRPGLFYLCDYAGYRAAFESGNYIPYVSATTAGVPGSLSKCRASAGLEDYTSSFPSGHAAIAFAGLGFLALALRWALRVKRGRWFSARVLLGFGGPLVLASWIAVTRVTNGWHFPADVLAGAVIGTVGAVLAWQQFQARPSFVRSSSPAKMHGP